MNRPELFWIDLGDVAPGRLAIFAAPDGLTLLPAAMRGLHGQGVSVLVSLLDPVEAQLLGLLDEPEQSAAAGMEFHHVPTRDHSTPSAGALVTRVVTALATHLSEGRAVAIHCYAGIGRSATLAGCVLRHLGLPVDATLARMSAARGFRVPETAGQRRFIEEFGDG